MAEYIIVAHVIVEEWILGEAPDVRGFIEKRMRGNFRTGTNEEKLPFYENLQLLLEHRIMYSLYNPDTAQNTRLQGYTNAYIKMQDYVREELKQIKKETKSKTMAHSHRSHSAITSSRGRFGGSGGGGSASPHRRRLHLTPPSGAGFDTHGPGGAELTATLDKLKMEREEKRKEKLLEEARDRELKKRGDRASAFEKFLKDPSAPYPPMEMPSQSNGSSSQPGSRFSSPGHSLRDHREPMYKILNQLLPGGQLCHPPGQFATFELQIADAQTALEVDCEKYHGSFGDAGLKALFYIDLASVVLDRMFYSKLLHRNNLDEERGICIQILNNLILNNSLSAEIKRQKEYPDLYSLYCEILAPEQSCQWPAPTAPVQEHFLGSAAHAAGRDRYDSPGRGGGFAGSLRGGPFDDRV